MYFRSRGALGPSLRSGSYMLPPLKLELSTRPREAASTIPVGLKGLPVSLFQVFPPVRVLGTKKGHITFIVFFVVQS